MHVPSLYSLTVPNMPVCVKLPGPINRVLWKVPEIVQVLSPPTDELVRSSQLESAMVVIFVSQWKPVYLHAMVERMIMR